MILFWCTCPHRRPGEGERTVRIAFICTGLGHVVRGHESFARTVFNLLKREIDITLYKGGGPQTSREIVVDHIPRQSSFLNEMHVVSGAKWSDAIKEQTRFELEMTTFAYGVLKHLLAYDYDIIHCTENRIVELLYRNRLLFHKIPRFLFSNGGALARRRLPECDFVQEHTAYNLKRAAPEKSFLIPHGVDLSVFDPNRSSDFRYEQRIPEDALLILSVGTICHGHKRMDYLVKEISELEGANLAGVGQRSFESEQIENLGARLLGDRVRFLTLPHERVYQAYRAADVFALASLFETFGIAYIEAMAMRLPVVATDHINQREIIKKGVFVNMSKPGAVTAAVRALSPAERRRIGAELRAVVEEFYDLSKLKERYLAMYEDIVQRKIVIPRHSLRQKIAANLRNLVRY
jgi:glycosyltransferase involved in cell wall biosynthesis